MSEIETSRRALLQGGAMFVGFAVAGRLAPSLAETLPPAKGVAADEVDSFLALRRDGSVIVYSGKVDLGTGVETALTQMVAEELEVPTASISIVQGDTALTPDQGPTFGSLSIQNGGVQLRQAAATVRKALLEKAAARLKSTPDDLAAANGAVTPKKGGAGIRYGELVGGKALALKLDKDAPLKDSAGYHTVGQSMARLDIPPKIFAKFTYMQDFRLPGMLHGRVVRPPAMEATLESVDEGSIKDIPGIVQIVRDGNFLGIVAKTEWAAIQAATQLKASWSDWAGLPEQVKLWDYVRATKINKTDTTSNVGDAPGVLAKGGKVLSATYDFAIHTHGSIGPSCAVAEFKDGKLTCWTASQATHALRQQLVLMFGLPADDVRAIYVEGAGCYGRNGHEDAAGDAALMAKAVGKPVRVQWMRADEHGWDPKGPPTLVDLKAALDEQGNVIAWQGDFYTPDGVAGTVPLVPASLAGKPHETVMSPGGVINNSAIPYKFPNVLTRAHRLAETPFRPSWIRSPGRLQNTFANESLIDEIVVETGGDPFEFRLKHLDPADTRGIETLTRLAKLAGWQKQGQRKPAASGDIATGRGMAYVKYELVRTYVGMVAEVEVNRKTGEIRARKFYVTQDCGLIINPDGVRNQIEGNMIQTLSRTLKEELTFDRSTVTSRDWASYPILTFPEIPEIEMDLIDRPTEKPWGAGEPSAAVVSAAIANAVYDAVGARLRSVPFTPAKVKAAMGSSI
ncbi:MAG TPA: molybdopterin cofactor-binding domain-containing protein [Aliidongia sp.]|nr:molybdopterin cofactor-binding domain-containing protein [Aliidongia sp.]